MALPIIHTTHTSILYITYINSNSFPVPTNTLVSHMVGHMANSHHHRRHSPSSSSSSDFEFGISHSPATEMKLSSQLMTADQLFYKGQLLPLQLSPRLSMIKTSSSSETSAGTSSSGTTTSASRDSNGSSIDSSCTTGNLLLLAAESAAGSSRRPSSAVQDDDSAKVSKYFFFASLAARFSSVFNRYRSKETQSNGAGSGGCGVSNTTTTTTGATACYFVPRGMRKISDTTDSTIASTPIEVIKKYVGKVKKLSGRQSQSDERSNIGNQKAQRQKNQEKRNPFSFSVHRPSISGKQESVAGNRRDTVRFLSAANPRPRRKKQRAMAPASSCPASTFSSPTHLPVKTVLLKKVSPADRHLSKSNTASSTMDDLHSAIQGAILHQLQLYKT